MSQRFILTIGLGPVQDFIAAARRTSDLQAGSELLVEMAKEAAKEIRRAGGQLLIPADPDKDGPNKILATVENPKEAADKARIAAQGVLDRKWEAVKAKFSGYLDTALGDDQVANFLEFYASWEPVPPNPKEFGDARKRAELRLAGRKALRNFAQPRSVPGRPKSPLDPSRDTVIRLASFNDRVPNDLQSDDLLWLKPREYLDAVSLIKRCERRSGTPSTAEMAIRPWKALLKEKDVDGYDELDGLIKATRGAVDIGVAFLRDDLEREFPQASPVDVRRITEAARRVAAGIRPHSLQPYYAILAADGDHMGGRLGECETVEDIQAFSRQLTAFATAAHDIIVKEADGHPVYCGGDDVLALLPVNAALACADALRKQFAGTIDGGSLSVGVAIVHHMEDLQQSVGCARSAEAMAKKAGRNRLCVSLYKRSGAGRHSVLEWSDDILAGEWEPWITAQREGGISRGFAYELQHLAREWTPSLDTGLLRAEATRILTRKVEHARRKSAPPIPEWVQDGTSLLRFAEHLIIARHLALYPAPDGGQK